MKARVDSKPRYPLVLVAIIILSITTGLIVLKKSSEKTAIEVENSAYASQRNVKVLEYEQHMLSSDQLSRLGAIRSGLLTRRDIEIVLSRHGEDISWSDMYSSIRTIYDKSDNSSGSASASARLLPASTAGKVVRLPNLGRESYTYLRHIVDNYDTLASVTVFSQASEPTHGYIGHRKGGGHLMSNSSFHDFVLSPTGHFVFTGAVWLPSLAHLLRSGTLGVIAILLSSSPARTDNVRTLVSMSMMQVTTRRAPLDHKLCNAVRHRC